MGSIGIAAFVGFWVFWILLVFGYVVRELSTKHVVAFLVLWIIGRIGLGYLGPQASAFFSPYVALLDIVLVFVVFKGDVPLS